MATRDRARSSRSRGRPTAVRRGGGTKLGLPQILTLVVAGLGLINFFVGFADVADGVSAELLRGRQRRSRGCSCSAALFVVPSILPRRGEAGHRAGRVLAWSAVLTVLFFMFTTAADIGVGTILMLIFGIVQAAAAVVAYLFEAGIMKPPTPGQPSTGSSSRPAMYPPSNQFPAQQPPPGSTQPGAPGQADDVRAAAGPVRPAGPAAPGTPPGGYPQQ